MPEGFSYDFSTLVNGIINDEIVEPASTDSAKGYINWYSTGDDTPSNIHMTKITCNTINRGIIEFNFDYKSGQSSRYIKAVIT